MSEPRVTVQLKHRQDYQFDTDFGAGIPSVLADEPPPLGQGMGPSPMHLLCAAVGNCLAASLRFACGKFKQIPDPVACEVTAEVGRNADRRMRVLGMTARLTLGVPAASIEHLDRILGSFEDFCTVTASVRAAFPVTVTVVDSLGVVVKWRGLPDETELTITHAREFMKLRRASMEAMKGAVRDLHAVLSPEQ